MGQHLSLAEPVGATPVRPPVTQTPIPSPRPPVTQASIPVLSPPLTPDLNDAVLSPPLAPDLKVAPLCQLSSNEVYRLPHLRTLDQRRSPAWPWPSVSG